MAIAVVMLDDHVPGLDATAAAWNPDGDMLLNRPRPDIHIAHLVILAVESEWLGLGPRAMDKRARLFESLADFYRRHTIREDRIHRRAEDEACHEASARKAVEVGVLFGDPRGWIVECQRIANDGDRRVVGGGGEAGGEQVRRGSHRAGSLMMFINQDPIETHLVSQLHQADEHLIGLADLQRISE